MRFDLQKPCRNCPFRTDETAIRFACRERAEEIENSAYRNGFPCHLSGEIDDDADDAGYEFGPNTQHCAGAMIMYLNRGGSGNVVFERLSAKQQGRLEDRLDFDAPVYENETAFLDSYGPEDPDDGF